MIAKAANVDITQPDAVLSSVFQLLMIWSQATKERDIGRAGSLQRIHMQTEGLG